MRFPLNWMVLVGLAVLATGVGVQVFRPGGETRPGRGKHLATQISAGLTGWTARDLPLGDTELVANAVSKTLGYDDILFREFRKGDSVVTIYAAYWAPARMPIQVVASHTPDRCWTGAGWTCEDIQHGFTLPNAPLVEIPGEWRRFRAPDGQRLEVQFWHLVDGQPYDFGERFNQVPSAWRWWRDAAAQVFRAPPEQYFIRLSCNRPFEQLSGDAGWQELARSLAGLGLGAAEASPRVGG